MKKTKDKNKRQRIRFVKFQEDGENVLLYIATNRTSTGEVLNN